MGRRLLDKMLGRGFRLGKFAREVDGTWVLVPGVFYPAMVAYIQEAVKQEGLPAELVDRAPVEGVDPESAARMYKGLGKRVRYWDDALVPWQEALRQGWTVERLQARAQVLELCRLWWTRAAKNGAEGKTKIRILADERYRLGVM